MEVSIRLFAHFREGRFKDETWDLAPGTTVRQVLDRLGISPEDVGVTMINSRHCELDQELAPGDRLAVFPVIGGG